MYYLKKKGYASYSMNHPVFIYQIFHMHRIVHKLYTHTHTHTHTYKQVERYNI